MTGLRTDSPLPEFPQALSTRRGVAWICFLILMSAISPLACDMYLPAFPAMAEDYGTSPLGPQLTMTTFLLGMAVGQLVLGPLSDRLGRRRPLLASTAVCIAAGIACALAPSIELLVFFRLVQGLAGAGCVVLSRAVVADTTKGAEAQKLFAVMTAVGGLAPVIAPLFGSLVFEFSGWRTVFWVLVLLTAAMFVGAFWAVPESLPRGHRHAGGLGALARHTRTMLRDRTFAGLAAACSLSFAVMFAYIPASPFVLQELHGLSSVGFSVIFAANALGLAVASGIAGRLAGRVPPLRIALIGVLLQFTSTLVVLALSLAGQLPTWGLVAGLFLTISSLGLVAGTTTGMALERVPYAVGTGAALLGALQFGLGALVSPLVGLGQERTQLPMLVVMASAAALATLFLLNAARGSAINPTTRTHIMPGRTF